MTLKSSQLEGYLITEREMSALEPLILDQYKAADKLISDKLRALYDKMQDGGVKPEDQYNWLIQYDRNIKLKKEIQSAYTKYDTAALNLTKQSGKIGMTNNYYRQFYMLNYQAPVSFSTIPNYLVEYAVTGQLDAWKSLSASAKERFGNSSTWPGSGTLLDIFKNNRSQTLRKIQAAINSNMMAGNGYKQTAAAISKIIGEITDGSASGRWLTPKDRKDRG